jgi:hypothetical protein
MRRVTIELDDELAGALRRLVDYAGNTVSEEEALRAVFRNWAISHGYLDGGEDRSRNRGTCAPPRRLQGYNTS